LRSGIRATNKRSVTALALCASGNKKYKRRMSPPRIDVA